MRERRSAILQKILAYVLLALGAFLMIGPFLWTLSTAVKGPGLAFQIPPRFFQPPFHFDNFGLVWEKANFLGYTLNSLFVTILSVIGVIIASSLAGFGLARYDFKGANAVFFIALATMMVPYQTLVIPQYVMWQSAHLLDTYVPIVAPFWFGTAFGVFMMRQCFKSLPGELYEAAIVDGCHPLRIFTQIYFPLAKTTVAALGVFTFIGEWNDVFKPLIYITTKTKYTLTIGLLYMRGEYSANIELLMAATVIMMIPILTLFIFAQKYFVQGIVSAGIKG